MYTVEFDSPSLKKKKTNNTNTKKTVRVKPENVKLWGRANHVEPKSEPKVPTQKKSRRDRRKAVKQRQQAKEQHLLHSTSNEQTDLAPEAEIEGKELTQDTSSYRNKSWEISNEKIATPAPFPESKTSQNTNGPDLTTPILGTSDPKIKSTNDLAKDSNESEGNETPRPWFMRFRMNSLFAISNTSENVNNEANTPSVDTKDETQGGLIPNSNPRILT